MAFVAPQKYVDRVVALDQRAGVVGHHHGDRRPEGRDISKARHRCVGVDHVDVEPDQQSAYLPPPEGVHRRVRQGQPGAEPDDRDPVVALVPGPPRLTGRDDRDVVLTGSLEHLGDPSDVPLHPADVWREPGRDQSDLEGP